MENAFLVFVGEINQISAGRIVERLTAAIISKCEHVHLLIQTAGGSVSDGIFLYQFIKTFPLKLTVYNIGAVSSAGVIVFLGAKTRVATARATFMTHKTSTAPISATLEIARNMAESISIDDKRTEEILREHITMTDTQWTTLQHHPLWITATEALKMGLITEIGDFVPPVGSVIYNV